MRGAVIRKKIIFSSIFQLLFLRVSLFLFKPAILFRCEGRVPTEYATLDLEMWTRDGACVTQFIDPAATMSDRITVFSIQKTNW